MSNPITEVRQITPTTTTGVPEVISTLTPDPREVLPGIILLALQIMGQAT